MVIGNLDDLILTIENDLKRHNRTRDEVLMSKVQERLEKSMKTYKREMELAAQEVVNKKTTNYLVKKVKEVL